MSHRIVMVSAIVLSVVTLYVLLSTIGKRTYNPIADRDSENMEQVADEDRALRTTSSSSSVLPDTLPESEGNAETETHSMRHKNSVQKDRIEAEVRALVDKLRQKISGTEDKIEALGVDAVPFLLKTLKGMMDKDDKLSWRLKQRIVQIIGDIALRERGWQTGKGHYLPTKDYRPQNADDPLHQACLFLLEYLSEKDLGNLRYQKDYSEVHFVDTVIAIFGDLGDYAATPYLMQLVEARGVSDAYGTTAAFSLCTIGDPRTFDFFIELLKEPKGSPYAPHVTTALALIGDKRAVPYLIQALDERGKIPSYAIIMALGELGDERAVPEIGEYLRTSAYVTASSACRALRKIGGLAAKQLLWGLADEAVGASPEYSPLYKRELLAKKYSYDGSISGLPLSVTEYEDGRPVRTIDVRKELSKCDRRETVPGYEERYYALRELAKMGDELALGEFILHIRKGLSFSGGDLRDKYRLNWMTAWDAELKAITGQDFGEDIDAWERWWRRGGGKKR